LALIEDGGRRFESGQGESVLEALLRGGEEVPHSCRKGVCQACLMQALEGEVPAAAQCDVKSTHRLRNYFLACRWQPSTNVRVTLPDAATLYCRANVESVARLSERICRLSLSPISNFSYYAGQFINLRHPGGSIRSYSLSICTVFAVVTEGSHEAGDSCRSCS
jgi:ferredoxin